MLPNWVLAIGFLVYIITLIKIHKRMKPLIKWAIAIPAICMIIIQITFSFFEIDADIRLNSGRISLLSFLLWQAFLIYYTRKMHI